MTDAAQDVVLVQLDLGTLATIVLVVVAICSISSLLALCCWHHSSAHQKPLHCSGCHHLLAVRDVQSPPQSVLRHPRLGPDQEPHLRAGDHMGGQNRFAGHVASHLPAVPQLVVHSPNTHNQENSATFQRLGMKQSSPLDTPEVTALVTPEPLSRSPPSVGTSPCLQPLTPSPRVSPDQCASQNLTRRELWSDPQPDQPAEFVTERTKNVSPFLAITDCEKNVTSRPGGLNPDNRRTSVSPSSLPIASCDQFVTLRQQTGDGEEGGHNYIHPFNKTSLINVLVGQSDATGGETSQPVTNVPRLPTLVRHGSLQNPPRNPSRPGGRLPSHPPTRSWRPPPSWNRRKTNYQLSRVRRVAEEGGASETENLI